MRAVLQRVSRARVRVDGETVGAIGEGLLILVGVARTDGTEDVAYLAEKVPHLRIFADATGHFSRSALETSASVLVVSQFTLYAETRKGRRPSFVMAAPPEQAEPLFTLFIDKLKATGLRVETGRFGAMMHVELVNEGPVTIVLDSSDRERSRRSTATGLGL